MATDKSPPRMGVIFQVGIITIILLIAVRTALGAYFDGVTQDELHRKIVAAKPEALMDVRADERRRLEQGSVPIEQAMHDLAAKGRTAASPAIVPTASRDVAPLQGWAKMPSTVPPLMTAPPPAPAPELAADAGATSSSGGAANPANGAAPSTAGTNGPKTAPGGNNAGKPAPGTAPVAPKKKP